MNPALVEQVIEAVLYEGYILYPYRASSKKNARERFTFGRVYPQAYSVAQKGAEPCFCQTECLLEQSTQPARLEISARFLHPLAREIGMLSPPLLRWADGTEPPYQPVEELKVDDQLHQAWLEALEREIKLPALHLPVASAYSQEFPFRFDAARVLEPIRDREERIPGLIIRRHEGIEGCIELRIEPIDAWGCKITVRVRNQTPLSPAQASDPDAVAMRTFASTHTLLHATDGGFVSLLEPSAEYKAAAAGCRNIGTWPVLVGEASRQERDTLLSSPIILYDYPQIAPESAGTFFDGTEIDEILSLRVLTLTEGEKVEMRSVDAQARRLLERTENLSGDSFLKLHGALRRPSAPLNQTTPAPPGGAPAIEFDDFFGAQTRRTGAWAGGVYLRAGDRVRLRPKPGADALDLALKGQVAIIEAVEEDAERRIHFAVVLENDPGKDLGFLRQPGHRFFYGVDEVEPLGQGVAGSIKGG